MPPKRPHLDSPSPGSNKRSKPNTQRRNSQTGSPTGVDDAILFGGKKRRRGTRKTKKGRLFSDGF